MQRTEKNIAELILELARKTGASDSYVGKVRALLQQRGISLDEDSAPYRAALEQAFRRQEEIRRQVQLVAEQISRLYRPADSPGDAGNRYGLEPVDVEDPSEVGRRWRSAREARVRKIVVEVTDRRPMVRGEKDQTLVPGPDTSQ